MFTFVVVDNVAAIAPGARVALGSRSSDQHNPPPSDSYNWIVVLVVVIRVPQRTKLVDPDSQDWGFWPAPVDSPIVLHENPAWEPM